MSHVFEASIRGDSGCFIYVSVKKGDRDRAGRERTLFILFILESTLFRCYYDYTEIKVDPLQIQMIPYSNLYDQNWQSISSSFHGHKENRRQLAPVQASAQGKPIRDRVGRVHSCHCQQGKETLQIYTIHVNDLFQGENGEFRRKVTSLHPSKIIH